MRHKNVAVFTIARLTRRKGDVDSWTRAVGFGVTRGLDGSRCGATVVLLLSVLVLSV